MSAIEVATRQRHALSKTVSEVVGRGKRVVVVGWRDSNHNQETRELAKSGLVDFILDPPNRFGPNTGLILCTKFITHSKFYQLRRNTLVHPVILSNGKIKKILEGSKDSFLTAQAKILEEKLKAGEDFSWPVAVSAVVNRIVANTNPPVIAEQPLEQAVMETSTTSPEVQSPDFEKFKRLFLERASIEGGMVGKTNLGKIRRECGLEKTSNRDLVLQGFVIPFISEGRTEAGRYRAGVKMTSEVPPAPEVVKDTKDPLIKARILIGTEAMVQDEIRTIQARLAVLETQLAKISDARKLIEQIESMFK